jgi:hypothetical protein
MSFTFLSCGGLGAECIAPVSIKSLVTEWHSAVHLNTIKMMGIPVDLVR